MPFFLALGLASACKSEEANPEQAVTSTLAPPADLLLANTTLSGANETPAVQLLLLEQLLGAITKHPRF